MALIAALTAVGGLLRFATLGTQSFWFDEALTVHLTSSSFGTMLVGVRATEALPPLYFVLAWIWTRLFDHSEVGLRSLSALAGTFTIPVAYAAAKALVGKRLAVAVAALTALSPALIWYSQEARPYALLTLLSSVSLLFFARARARSEPRDFVGWAGSSVLAVTTHYFALFVVIPEALWLLWDARSRRAGALASCPIVVAMVALAPLALYQRVHAGPAWIATTGFRARLATVPYFFVTGNNASPTMAALVAIVVGFVVLALAFVLRAVRSSERTGALLALGVGAVAIAIPVAGKFVGNDYVLGRNLLVAWLPLAIFLVAGLASLRAPLVALGLVGACLLFLVIDVEVPSSPGLQRDDWRGVAQALGPPSQNRIIVLAPYWQHLSLATYRPRLRVMPPTERVSEIDTITYNGFVPFNSPVRTITPGLPFRQVETQTIHAFTIDRYQATRPILEPRSSLTNLTANGFGPLVELPSRAASQAQRP